MHQLRHPPRRTPSVVLLDAVVDSLGAARRKRFVAAGLVAASGAVLIVTALLVLALVRSPEALAPLDLALPGAAGAPPAGPRPTEQPSASPSGSISSRSGAVPAGSTSPRPSAPTTVGPPSRPEVPAALAARYATEPGTESLLSYRASVAVDNPGRVPVTGWTLVITLPRRTLTVSDVVGATARQDDAVWTFTPDPRTATVPALRSVLVSFQVNGATAIAAMPIGCTIDGRPCAGLPG